MTWNDERSPAEFGPWLQHLAWNAAAWPPAVMLLVLLACSVAGSLTKGAGEKRRSLLRTKKSAHENRAHKKKKEGPTVGSRLPTGQTFRCPPVDSNGRGAKNPARY
jgi:hypothetical protein